MATEVRKLYACARDEFGNISQVSVTALIIDQGSPLRKSNRAEVVSSNISMIFKTIATVLDDINNNQEEVASSVSLETVSEDKLQSIFNNLLQLQRLTQYKSVGRFKQKIREAIQVYYKSGTEAGLKALISLFVDYPPLEVIDPYGLFATKEIARIGDKPLLYGNLVMIFNENEDISTVRKGHFLQIRPDSRDYEVFKVDDDPIQPKIYIAPAFDQDYDPNLAVAIRTPYIETAPLEGEYILYFRSEEGVEVYNKQYAAFKVGAISNNKIKLHSLKDTPIAEIPFNTFSSEEVLKIGSNNVVVAGLMEQIDSSPREMWLEVSEINSIEVGDTLYKLELDNRYVVNEGDNRALISGLNIYFDDIEKVNKHAIIRVSSHIKLIPYNNNIKGFVPGIDITDYFEVGTNNIQASSQDQMRKYLEKSDTHPIAIQKISYSTYPIEETTITTYTEANRKILYIDKSTGELTLNENVEENERVLLDIGGAFAGINNNVLSNYFIYFNYNATTNSYLTNNEYESFNNIKRGIIPAHVGINIADRIHIVADTYINNQAETVVYEMSNDIVVKRYVGTDNILLSDLSQVYFMEPAYNDKIWTIGPID